MTLNKTIKFSRGFTLIELMDVIALIGIIVGALGTSVAQARQRAKIERARSEASILTQAILAYENYNKDVELPEMEDEEASLKNLSIFIGEDGKMESGDKIPALMLAQLRTGNKMRDPWNTPYRIRIRQGKAAIKMNSTSGKMQTGFWLPNFYRLSEEERK